MIENPRVFALNEIFKTAISAITKNKKYGIKSVPTIIVADEDGNEIKRIRDIIQLKQFLADNA